MPNTTNRDASPRNRGTVEHRLTRLLDTTSLATVVPRLTPETLHQLVQFRGLEACGDLVTLATPAQLTSLLDLDLWRPAQPGRDEQFDVDRFGEWIEMLVDVGESVAARTVAALDRHLIIAGLSRYLRVFDPGTFEPTAASDDEPMNRQELMNSEGGSGILEWEVGGYLVRARTADSWDAIIALLIALESGHRDDFHEVMQGCRGLSNSRPEVDGLDDLLMKPEQHLHDVAAGRERRRSQSGYASPADARAFLQLARRPQETRTTRNPIAAAYFRAADDDENAATTSAAASTGALAPATLGDTPAASSAREEDDVRTAVEAIVELVAEATRGDGQHRTTSQPPRALLKAAEEAPGAAKIPILKRLMDCVLHHDENAHLARSRELAFLANTLLAGTSIQARPFTPQEASDAAACICNLGLECWPSRWPAAAPGAAGSSRQADTAMLPDSFLVSHDLVTAFEAGWSLLFEEVSLFVADRLALLLADVRCGDAEAQRGLRALRRQLVKQHDAGTPWLARDAAEILATLDMTAWISVLALLDECPILPAALTAILERRTTPVHPTAFDFFSTRAQIEGVRRFMTMLPDVLSR